MIGITRKQFFAYSVLPGFRPRIQELFMAGFNYIPYFIALVYQSVRLLPANHPYGDARNLGRFGIRHVIAEAANNLVISRKNLDQLVLFVTILFGLILMIVQFAMLGFSFIFQPAMAAANFASFFVTPTPRHDLAFMMLDLVFGVPNFFESCVDTVAGGPAAVTCQDIRGQDVLASNLGPDVWPYPVHLGLRQMFQLYSTGLLVVAALITTYFIFTVVAETAQSGQAFGKRFNKVWAPIRIVVAFGLLIPVANGLNSSQYIVLFAAKLGSSFATNGWNLFNASIVGANDTVLGNRTTLVTSPNTPDISHLVQFMFTAATCRQLERISGGKEVDAYLVKDPLTAPNNYLRLNDAYSTVNWTARPPTFGGDNIANFTPYQTLVTFANGATRVSLRFGVYDEVNYAGQKGFVKPVCGEISIPLNDPRSPAAALGQRPEPGAEMIQRFYWWIIQFMWYTAFVWDDVDNQPYPYNLAVKHTAWNNDPAAAEPNQTFKSDVQAMFSEALDAAIRGPAFDTRGLYGAMAPPAPLNTGAVPAQANSATAWTRPATLQNKGWAGAGIWYNRVAELNGRISTAAYSVPSIVRYPQVMEHVLSSKKEHDKGISVGHRFEPKLKEGDIRFEVPGDAKKADVLHKAFYFWEADSGNATPQTTPTANPFIDMINALLGTEGLYSMRRNPDAHPLAQLVGIGRSLVESSIRNTILAGASAGLGAVLSAATLEKSYGAMGAAFVGMFMTIAMIGMTAGFVLFYIIPFLPFIYFFFAVGGWVKAIFEAMVGAPLWALAHIRIDGNGLPGHAAVNGYFLIFEIFLRPILIVFGLLASISIFSALILVLNQTWTMVTSNLTGFDVQMGAAPPATLLATVRGPIDEFFFTVVYAIIAYLMAMSSFKLIDLIPGNILRWMGQTVPTFSEQREDAAQGLVGTSYVGAQQAISQIGGGLQGAMQKVAGPK